MADPDPSVGLSFRLWCDRLAAPMREAIGSFVLVNEMLIPGPFRDNRGELFSVPHSQSYKRGFAQGAAAFHAERQRLVSSVLKC